MTTREKIQSYLEIIEQSALLLDPGEMYDEAIIGLVESGDETVVAYDRQKIIEALMRDGADREEAEEFFEFNIAGACVAGGPIYIDTRWAE